MKIIKWVILLLVVILVVLSGMIYWNLTRGQIMYAEDSAFIVEHYSNEIMFVEHITGKEINSIHSGAFRDILDVHNMILNKEIEGPCLRTLVIELSDATTAYKIKHPPIHPKE